MDGDAFPAASHEEGLDRLVQPIWELREELERRPALAKTTALALRNRVFPTPAPLKLWGWDALGTTVAYYDPGVVQVMPDAVSGLAYGKQSLQVTATAGAVQLTVPGLITVSG